MDSVLRGLLSLICCGDNAMTPLDYLVIAPHPDDAELGVGGTIPLLQAQGRGSASSI